MGRPSGDRRYVGHAGKDQFAAVALDDDVFVLEHVHSHPGIALHPSAVAENVFVVSRDDVDAVRRAQVPHRLDVGASRGEGAVDQIARHRDQVHAKAVRPLDDGPRPGGGKKPADMKIGQLQDGVAVELRCESRYADFDILERRHPNGLMDADCRQDGGEASHRVAHGVGHCSRCRGRALRTASRRRAAVASVREKRSRRTPSSTG